jgi:hypothetical protein
MQRRGRMVATLLGTSGFSNGVVNRILRGHALRFSLFAWQTSPSQLSTLTATRGLNKHTPVSSLSLSLQAKCTTKQMLAAYLKKPSRVGTDPKRIGKHKGGWANATLLSQETLHHFNHV